jgi:Holliday junction resolvase RusA-like endonuclease
MVEQKFVLPFVARSLNQWTRQHRFKAAREKKRIGAITRACLLSQGARLFHGPVEIEFLLVFRTNRNRDIDNYGQKFVTDALKGVIIEDDNSNIVRDVRIRFAVEPGCEERTEITVREVEA